SRPRRGVDLDRSRRRHATARGIQDERGGNAPASDNPALGSGAGGSPRRQCASLWIENSLLPWASENYKRGRGCGPCVLLVVMLLHVDGLAVGVECAPDADLLAFVLLQSVLAVDVIVLAAGILQNVLVT